MSRRSEGGLFVGRLSKNTRIRDLEDLFEPYGRVTRCDLKYGAEMGYAFVDFEDRRDAEDALKYENGREVCGSSIIVEWAKGNPRRGGGSPHRGGGGGGGRSRDDECFKCRRVGHWARDCPDDSRYGYRRPSNTNRRSRSMSRDRNGAGGSRSRYNRSRSRDSSRRRPARQRSRSHSRGSGSKSPRANGGGRSRSRSH